MQVDPRRILKRWPTNERRAPAAWRSIAQLLIEYHDGRDLWSHFKTTADIDVTTILSAVCAAHAQLGSELKRPARKFETKALE